MAEIKQRLRDAESKAESTASELSALKASNESNQATLDAEKRATEALRKLWTRLDKTPVARRQPPSRNLENYKRKLRRWSLRCRHNARCLLLPACPTRRRVCDNSWTWRTSRLNSFKVLLSDARVSQNTSSFTNKKNEDFSETDIEGAVLTGGSHVLLRCKDT